MSETAYFGAGCFWGAELAFSEVPGVLGTEVGFSNIKISNGKESRVETVKVEFDPSELSFGKLIEIFWTTHNPSDKQHKSETYVEKSILFGVDDHQLQQANNSLEDRKKKSEGAPIYTIAKPLISYNKAPMKDQKYYFKEK